MSNPSITYGIRWDYGLLSWQGLCLELRARKPQYLINDISVPLAEWMSTMRMHGLQAEALAALARMPVEIRPDDQRMADYARYLLEQENKAVQ